MSDLDVHRILSDMRATATQAKNETPVPQNSDDFAMLLQRSIDSVNETQMQAGKSAEAFELGETDTSLSEVMVSLQKASLSFQAMVQVRNKLVEAYKDVMNMPM